MGAKACNELCLVVPVPDSDRRLNGSSASGHPIRGSPYHLRPRPLIRLHIVILRSLGVRIRSLSEPILKRGGEHKAR